MDVEAMVAVLEIEASTPPMSMRFPAATSSAGMKYLYNELTSLGEGKQGYE